MPVNDGVPCPMCCNSKVAGQIERPENGRWESVKDDFGLDKLPPFIMSTPCPMCHGEQHISREKWDMILSRARRIARKHMDKKKEAVKKYDETQSMWNEMQELKRQQKSLWEEQGPFKFKKVD